MGRKQINGEQTVARFPSGTLKRIDAVLREKEARADLLRQAIEREIARREQQTRRRRPTGYSARSR